MSDYYQKLAASVQERFGNQLTSVKVAMGELTIEVPREHLLEVCRVLRDEEAFAFEQLTDLCGVDYSTYGEGKWRGPRFASVCHLLSIKNNHRIRVRTFADDELPIVDSVVGIWNSANWYERESFDLYGIVYEGHPDLRRILTDYGFIGHPFRKDFPVEGQVEMRYDPEQMRVIYEPVSIEVRNNVPRVIRDDHRYVDVAQQEQGEK